jgi:hypothetical protein
MSLIIPGRGPAVMIYVRPGRGPDRAVAVTGIAPGALLGEAFLARPEFGGHVVQPGGLLGGDPEQGRAVELVTRQHGQPARGPGASRSVLSIRS